MIRYLCDTSFLVALLCAWHEHHARTRAEIERRARADEQLILAAHSLAETYAVLTRLPAPNRLRAADAIALLEANWSGTPVVHLTASETWDALHEAKRHEVIGGQMYDALIAVSAMKAGASTIVTWNVRDFAAFSPEISAQAPP